MKIQNFLKAIVLVSFCVALTGCSSIGLMSSKAQTFTGTYSIDTKNERPDILYIIAEVGKSLRYEVSSINKEMGSISLSRNEGFFSEFMTGEIDTIDLDISSENNGHKLNIVVNLFANFGHANQEIAMKHVEEFKAKLLDKIGR